MLDHDVFVQFVNPGEVVEVRIIGVYGKYPAWGGEFAKGTVSGYFDDHNAFCKAVSLADKANHGGIYFTLQVIDPRLIGRAFNRLRATNVTTSDLNVIAYRWLPIDIDPVRPSGISSSDGELKKALNLRDRVAKQMMSETELPAPIRAVSGNGGHLLFRLPDLPVNEKSKLFIKSVLNGIASKNNTDSVKIDTTVFNPGRIWKLYGTTSKKGDAVPTGKYREARPHRLSYIEDMGNQHG